MAELLRKTVSTAVHVLVALVIIAALWVLLNLAASYFTLKIINPGALQVRLSRSMEPMELELAPFDGTMSKDQQAEMDKYQVKPVRYRIPRAYVEFVTDWDQVRQSQITLRYSRKTLQPTTFEPPIGPTDPKLEDQVSLVLWMGLKHVDFEALKQSRMANANCKKTKSEFAGFERCDQYLTDKAVAEDPRLAESYAQYYFYSMPDPRFGFYILCARATERCELHDFKGSPVYHVINIRRSEIGDWNKILSGVDNFVSQFVVQDK